MQTAAVFLSLKFHRLQPQYVHNRIKALQRAFRTFVLAQVSKAAIDHHCTLLVAFSDLECARYLELLKAYENKPADSLQPRIEAEHTARCAAHGCLVLVSKD
jgi:DNA excision repair protein ERCC-1